jgi:hypothetical protein
MREQALMSPAATGLAAAGDDEAAAGDVLAEDAWLAAVEAEVDGEGASGESAAVWVATTTGDGVIGAADLVPLLQDARLNVTRAIPALAARVLRRMAAPNDSAEALCPDVRSQPAARNV